MSANPSRRIRFGVIGVGPHAEENLLPALRCIERAELAGITSRRPERAAALAERFRVPWFTTDWRELVQADEIDAVLVSAPPAVHAEVVEHCLEHGVHVFVEKPPAPDLASLKRLVELASMRPDTVTFVDYNFRFGASYSILRQALNASGDPISARLRFLGSKPLAPMWGQDTVERSFLYALGIHAIEMTVELFGSFRSVQVQRRVIEGGRFTMDALIRFESGATASLALGNYSNRFEYELELVTTGGAVGVLTQHRALRVWGLPDLRPFDGPFHGKQTLEYEWPSLHGGHALTGYSGALESFVDTIQGRTPAASPLSRSIEVYRLLESLLASRSDEGATG